MYKSNFNFLQPFQPAMADLGRSAEKYAYSDPQSAIVKLRCYAELYVGFIYKELSLPAYDANNLFDLLDNTAFKKAVEQCVVDKLHLIRMKGNKAAHPGGVSINDALAMIKEAYFLSAWIYLAYYQGNSEDLPEYQQPEPVKPEDQQLKQDKQQLQQSLDLQTADLERAKQELKVAQQQQLEAQQKLAALNQEVNQAKLDALQRAGQQATASFDFQEAETRRQISMQDVFAEYQLTDGQSELVSKLDDFLVNKNQSVFLLKGYAGTGKTFITKGLTEYFRTIGRNYVLAAPTGKAAKVIANKTGSSAFTIHKTIFSFNDIVEYQDEGLEGSETYKYYAKLAVNELSVDTVYIIDEASMISDIYNEAEFFRFGSGYLLKDFLKFVNLDHNDHRKKIIFIGDDAQLPPVGMSTSPALNPNYLRKEYRLSPVSHELTEVVRQKAGSGVMHNAINLRQALKANVFNELDINLSFPDMLHVDYQDLLTTYMESCSGKINDKSIVIASSNADVAAYNKTIRSEFFPGQPCVVAGDKVMAVNNNDTYGFFISNGDFGLVRQVLGEPETRKITIRRRSQATKMVAEIVVPLQFRKVEVGFRDQEGKPRFFQARVIENLLYSDAPNLSSDENKALYQDFCIRHPHLKRGDLAFKETLRSDSYFNALRVKFGYAITCHKAQGSEWKHVFVKCKTHHKQLSADYFRWLYTAMTRTSNNLYMLDEPHIKLGTGIKMVSNPGFSDVSGKTTQSTQLQEEQANSYAAPPVAHSAPPVPDSIIASDTFGIPPGNHFLTSLLDYVRRCIGGSGIDIYDIEHKQYLEAYIFCKGAETARVNISYNSKQKVTSLLATQVTELSSYMLDLLLPLKGKLFATSAAPHTTTDRVFNEPFLEDFHKRLLKSMDEKGIELLEVTPQQFSLRYRLGRANDYVTVLIYYNGQKQFTSCNPLHNHCTSQELLDEVLITIQEGLS